MKSKDAETRMAIIEAVLGLMEKFDDVQKITVREIAKIAGVGIGSINYHFQSKEKLINKAVQFSSGKNIEGLLEKIRELPLSPREKIVTVLKIVADKMAEFPNFSRIAMQNELFNEYGLQDNSMLLHNFTIEMAKQVYGDEKSEKELHIMLHEIGSSLQAAFLRNDRFKLHYGIDFYDDEQRNELVQHLIDNILKQ